MLSEFSKQNVLDRLTAGFQRFQHRWFCAENNIYAELAEGQSPFALVVACSDSRVDPVLLLDCHPGELFVIRNVANIIPPHAPDKNYHGVSAALEFGVKHLKVKNIIVMGHAECGGVKALLDETDTASDDFLGVWMQIIKKAGEQVNIEMPEANAQTKHRACEMMGIRISLDNLMTFPWIAEAVKAEKLNLYGWYFDLNSGELLQWDEKEHSFLPLVKPCKIETV